MKISQVVKINARSLQKDYPFQEIEYIDISSVGTGILNESPIKLNLSKAPSRARRLVQSGDTIISTVRPNRRSFFYIRDPKENTVVSTGFAVLSPTPQVDSRYLYYWVSRPEFSDYLSAHAKGVAYPAVSPEDIGGAEILLPSLPIQRRIASILSAYDDLIENNLRRIKILEEMARALYREWFIEFRFPGHEKVPLVSSVIGPIPKGWRIAPLSSVVDFMKGRKPNETRESPLPGDVRLLLIDVLRGGSPIFASPEKIILAEMRDTLMVMDGSNSCEVTTGYSGAVGSTLGRFRVKEPNILSPHALHQFLLSKEVEFRLKNIGVAIPHANKDYIFSQSIVIPPRPIMAQFDVQAAPIYKLVEIQKLRVYNLRRTRDLLLPRLLSGQIPVEAAVPA